MENEEKTSRSDLDWENRTLCSDEGCIGVIGPDGHCRECGKPFEGEFLKKSPSEESDEREETEENDAENEEESTSFKENHIGENQEDSDPEDAEPDWENRTLCSDDSCIGVIGPDGRCKECGLPFKG